LNVSNDIKCSSPDPEVTMLKSLAITAAIFASTTAVAAPGMSLDGILLDGNEVVTVWNSKIPGCAAMYNEDGFRTQLGTRMYCDTGLAMTDVHPNRALHLTRGDWIQMCMLHDDAICTDFVEVRSIGDVNGDGGINVIDLQILGSYIVNGEFAGWQAEGMDMLAADMNADGALNVLDMLLLIDVVKAEAAGL
jgi:hypothetical protein